MDPHTGDTLRLTLDVRIGFYIVKLLHTHLASSYYEMVGPVCGQIQDCRSVSYLVSNMILRGMSC